VTDSNTLRDTRSDPRSRRRAEDERFLLGQGQYTDDLHERDDLIAFVLRSPHAHAKIRSIATQDALSIKGVRAILTGADAQKDGLGPLSCSLPLPGLIVPHRLPLATDHVRFMGDPVALIIATSHSVAQDAAEAIHIEYETLPAIARSVDAQKEGAITLWPEAPNNRAFLYEKGDAKHVEDALSRAAHIAELDIINNRIVAMALEPRTVRASYDPQRDHYTLILSAASLHLFRPEIAHVLGVKPDQIDLITPDAGGGFGMKNVAYPEYSLLAWAAKKLGKTLRWTADRLDEFSSGVHGRDNVTRARLALDAKGRFLALDVKTIANLGAYVSSLGPGSATTAPTPAMGGVYAIPAMHMLVEGVFTNTAPVDAYRGAGKPEANYVIERLIDCAARQFDFDPIALRRMNLPKSYPHVNAFGYTIDSGAPRDLLNRALIHADFKSIKKRKMLSRKKGLLRGLGFAFFVETSRGPVGEDAWLRLHQDGCIDLAVGTQSNGQGHETSMIQYVSDRLGIGFEQFRYVQADTRTIARGGGHGGARSFPMAGPAMLEAADQFRTMIIAAAATLLQADTRDCALTDMGVKHHPSGRILSFRDIAQEAGALEAHGRNEADPYNFPMGFHVAEVEIDPETGSVTLMRYSGVDDYGTLINPLLAEGQVHGGLAQGIGQALMENIVYDEQGQLISATLMDYAVPRGADLPDLEIGFVENPSLANPLGVKGAGQAGAIAAPQTIMNAIMDALAPYGITHLDMPATPETIWRAIQRA
jgi:aerobic carbon-monoxide dehydrogenase large subunit